MKPRPTRRDLLALLGAGAGLTLLPRVSSSQLPHAFPNIGRRLLVVFAQGGLRSVDFCDAYTTADVETDYLAADCLSVAGDWSLPPAAESLEPFMDRMALVRHVHMESAAHPTGVRIGWAGLSRDEAPAVPVVVADSISLPYPIRSISLPDSLATGALQGPVSGEPADLMELFSTVHLGSDASLDAQIQAELLADNTARLAAVRKASPLRDWSSAYTVAESLDNGTLPSKIDPGDVDVDPSAAFSFHSHLSGAFVDAEATALRFAGALKALRSNLTAVASVRLGTFDTHDSYQRDQCTALAKALGEMMTRLAAVPAGLNKTLLDRTTIVVMSDFDRGRTLNDAGGTDHGLHGSVVLFGNGIKSRAIHGAAGNYPGELATGVRRRDIWATILCIFGVDHRAYFTDATPITDVLA